MDKARIEAIRARCEAATPGTWTVENGEAVKIRAPHGGAVTTINWLYGRFGSQGRIDGNEGNANADFIAHAREDVPALIDALEMSDIEMYRQKALAVHNEGVKECRDARIEALERALKSHDPCISCVNQGKCPCRFDCFPISEARFYVFDEARFTQEPANVVHE